MSNDPLLQPYTLKNLTLRNRILTTPHEPAYAEDGLPKDRYRAYHVERAKGGVGMTMTAGAAAVSKDSPPVFNNVLAYKDEIVPWLKKLTDEVHEYGAAAMIQLTHLGRRTTWNKGHWLTSVSSTRELEPSHRAYAKLAEEWDLKRIVNDFAAAAERMKAGGMDGIELESYGHLTDQLLSPLTNYLENDYGGTFDNRIRFAHEVLSAMRAVVGEHFILGIRMVFDETLEGGLEKSDGIAIAKKLHADGLIDYVSVIRGHIETDAGLTDVIPIQGMKSAPHLDFAGEIRRELGIPTMHAARIPDVATARHAVSSGLLDLVGMTRAHLADPYLVTKIREKREDEIRPCVGANYCLDRIYQGGEALCIHNAATGREEKIPHENIPRAKIKKRVMIVGAGPAGLEAARVAAHRGHDVAIFEAASDAGGQIRLTAQSKRRAEMMGIIDWRMMQCTALGVDFHFNTFVEPADVTTMDPDVVIIATGGIANDALLRDNNDLAVTSWDILSGDVSPAQNVLIYDVAGDHAGLMAAEIVANAGGKVEIMTPDRAFAPEVMAMNLVPYMRSLQEQDTQFTVTYRLKALNRDGNQIRATIGTDYSDHTRHKSYDQIIYNGGVVPLDDLYLDLRDASTNGGEVDQAAFIDVMPQTISTNPDGKYQLFRIGDAVSARNTHAAIYDALRLMVAV